MKYSVVCIDLDGTVVASAPGVTNSVAHALERMGIQRKEGDDLLAFVGPPLKESFQKFYGASEELAAKGVDFYREYYQVKGIFECEVYPGVREMLDMLRAAGKRPVLCTSKPEHFAKMIIDHFGMTDQFEMVLGASMDESRLTKADVIRYVLDQMGASPEDAIMVGDRYTDIKGAQQMGLASVGILYGYGDREELEKAGADYILDTAVDVAKLIIEG